MLTLSEPITNWRAQNLSTSPLTYAHDDHANPKMPRSGLVHDIERPLHAFFGGGGCFVRLEHYLWNLFLF